MLRIEPGRPALEHPFVPRSAWIRRASCPARKGWIRAANSRADREILLLGEVRQLVEANERERLSIESSNVGFVLTMREPDTRSRGKFPRPRGLIEFATELAIERLALREQITKLRRVSTKNECTETWIGDPPQNKSENRSTLTTPRSTTVENFVSRTAQKLRLGARIRLPQNLLRWFGLRVRAHS